MKYLKRFAPLVLALALIATAFVGCGKDGLSEISEKLSTYTIDAKYDADAHALSAEMTLEYVNNYDVELDCIKFHLYPAAFREGARYSPVAASEEYSAYPSGKNYGGIEIGGVKENGKDVTVQIEGSDSDILTVPLSDKLLPGGKTKVDISFKVSLALVRHRLGYYGKTVNLGNFYPIACVYEGGGFRTDPYYSNGDPFYSECANYEVTFSYPSAYKLACTGTATSMAEGDMTVTKSSAKAVRDFAAVLGEFEVIEGKSGDTTVRYYYYSDSQPEGTLKAACDALTTFSDMFGKYPYAEYNVAETSFLQGGMEYPNLVMISDALNRSIYLDAVIHETAHQWWYGVVGNDEINEAWMDEALTEYSTSLFYAKNPDYEVDFEARISDAMTSYLLYIERFKSGENADTSMDRSLAQYADNSEYAYMVYVKGELMFDNLRRTIGDDSFYAALKDYYERYYMSVASTDGLIACFEKSASRELKGYFDSWLGGKVLSYGK